ncbi:hypothetical protein AAG906_015431 [Vitis piasezkii]
MDCTMAMGHAALPVFYNMDPSHVRKQTGSFAQAFAKHEEVYKEQMEKVINLKHASTGFSSISILTTSEKFLMQTTTNFFLKICKHESILIEELVTDISNKLIGTSSCYAEGLVGMDSRIKAMDSPLCIGLDNVQSVGIWGMGGIGKTTIARAINEQIYTQFEVAVFLKMNFNTRINFVKDRLQSKKILIVLDDVDNLERLEYLAGKHDCEAFQLFCQYAFKHNDPGEDYMQLCYDVIHYSKGLPYKSIHEWKSELDKLKEFLTKRDIFLDIACFCKWEDKDFVTEILASCGFFPDIGIRVLIDKSLIIVSDNKLCMYDLLQEMGWEIVWQESLKYPEKHNRLWIHEDVSAALTRNTVRPKYMSFVYYSVCNMRLCGSFEYFSWKELCVDSDACTRMNKLNQFKDYCLKLKELPEVLENMGSLLKLFLYGTAIKKLPSSIQHLSGLVPLNLRECKSLAILPHSIRKLKSLQALILSGCSKLDNLPKGLGPTRFRKLEAAGTAIKELPPSISLLENLEVLSFEDGFQLHSLFGLRSLRKLNLSDCNILEGAIPNDFSSLCSLEYLDLSRNNFVTLPASLNQLSQLKGLRLGYCKRLQSLPELPSSIEEIDAHDCRVTENILCPSSVYRSKELVQPTEYRLHSNGTSASKLVYTRLMGLAVCAIFVVKGAVHDCPGKTGHLFAPINPEHQNSSDEGHRFIKSDHMWLGYQPISRIGIGHANWLNKLSQIQASFQVYGPSYGVKKCGVHLLYQQDEKEDNQPEFQCSTTDENSSFFTIKDYGGRKLVDTLRDIYTYLQGRRVWKLLENARDIHTYLHLARDHWKSVGVLESSKVILYIDYVGTSILFLFVRNSSRF